MDGWAACTRPEDNRTTPRRSAGRLLLAFERAEHDIRYAREHERLLTIAIVGGGPTGSRWARRRRQTGAQALGDRLFAPCDPQAGRA